MTDRVAPVLMGLYSLQATEASGAGSELYIYSDNMESLLRWKRRALSSGRFRTFMLRKALDAWTVYNAAGECTGERGDVRCGLEVEPCMEVANVDRQALLDEAAALYGNKDLSLVACLEQHAGASSADHSNLGVMCRHIIMEASSSDLSHICMVDSRLHPGVRVVSIFADVANLSASIQDAYLDRYQYLRDGWPLSRHNHTDTMAHRLLSELADTAINIIKTAASKAGWSEQDSTVLLSVWCMANPGSKMKFARHMMGILAGYTHLRGREVEEIRWDDIDADTCQRVLEPYPAMLRVTF